jgi:CRISPR-associated protein Csc3
MTLLQTLLINTLREELDPILQAYIETVLPAMEQEFALIPALGGSEAVHRHRLKNDPFIEDKIQRWTQNSDQSLLVHVLNALLTAWNLLPFLNPGKQLSDDEKRLLCLGLTLHDYNKYCQGEEEDPPKAHEVSEILQLCQDLGEKLRFSQFWSEWRDYLSDIGFLAQNTQYKTSTNPYSSNWQTFKLADKTRLRNPLRPLLAFGDIAVHMSDPSEVTDKRGDRLREHLRSLQINRKLVYHRLRDCTGLLSNGIHNAVLYFTEELDWQPILFFAQGVVYLAPLDSEAPDRETLQTALWNNVSQLLGSRMLGGEIGFKRDGKGLKVAPQTLELFSPAELIRGLPDVIEVKVNNKDNPATGKRLQALDLNEEEQKFLIEKGADNLRSDRLAEFISFAQKEFFSDCPDFASWILHALGIQERITPEQTQTQSGGVNYGWYHAAACYVAQNNTIELDQLTQTLRTLANELVTWAETNHLLPEHHSPTRDIFSSYLNQYLEVAGWEQPEQFFQNELVNYVAAKTKAAKQPICSLSSGEFASEDQMDSVVLFKPQQYSNKNSLGGRQIKRGISKIWSLEMLLRQARWAVPAGKLEEQQPVFLYIFPAYVYSPQMAKAIRVLIKELGGVNFGNIRKFWQEHGMNANAIRMYLWLQDEAEPGRFTDKKYGLGEKQDLPFMAITYTTTRGKTATDAWVEPAFLAIVLPFLLGVKVVASTSPAPLYNSDSEFRESVKLDGPAGFWNSLGLPTSMHLEEWLQGRVQRLDRLLNRLLIAYSVHLDCKGNLHDPRWRALPNTVREMITDVLNIFSLADSHFRDVKRDPNPQETQCYWHYAQLWSEGNTAMETQLELTKRLVQDYRMFYKVNVSESSHAILLPLSKALEDILSVPSDLPIEDLIFQIAGRLHDSVQRQKAFNRPLIMDKSLSIETRQHNELQAIHKFVTTCVKELFLEHYKGDRALLQENRNRIKSGAEFAYRWLELQEKQTANNSQQPVKGQS